MSHAGVSRTVVVLVAAASLGSCYKEAHEALQELAPSTGSIHVNFSCSGVRSLALEDSVGHTAWVVRRNPNDLITWVVPPTVTINSIAWQPPNIVPVDTAAETHGGAPGVAFNGKVSP